MEASDSTIVSTRQAQIAKLGRQLTEQAITSLNHHLDMVWMREAYRRTRKDGAAGVDGQTAESYERDLEGNLGDLLERAKSGRYVAPPVRRAHIPKEGGETRPIGIPTLEDKVLQRAVVMLLEPIWEQRFHGCSYGFRPGRGAHDALEALWRHIMSQGGCWIIDADIRKYFDSVDRGRLQELVRKRVSDGVIGRLIGKWLHAGVMEEGVVSYPEMGTPQGGVISPLLSNIYLDEVLDDWFQKVAQPRLSGRAFLVRYADDFVMGLEWKDEAARMMAVLPKRFERFGLTIHPDKTRLVDFRRPAPAGRAETFEFLGFLHYWGKSPDAKPVVRRKTAKRRLARGLKAISAWCRRNLHRPVADQAQALKLKLRGHYQYYGLTGNRPSLQRFYRGVCARWRYWLNRRSRKRDLPWHRFFHLLAAHPLPEPEVVHSIYRSTAKSLT